MMRSSLLVVCSIFWMLPVSCRKGDQSSSGEKTGKNSKREMQEQAPFSPGTKLGALTSKKLKEVSGLAASVANENMLWTLNDSGNDAEVYLIDRETNIKMTYVLKGVENRDWEEISVGRGPEAGKNYVYVGDIGDNLAVHQYKYFYRFEEPVYKPGASDRTEITKFDTIVFSLSDEQRDTEAFFIDPVTGDIYLIAKWKSPVDFYLLTATAIKQDTAVAQRIGTLPFSTVVAAAFNRDGSELLIKTLRDVYYWKREPSTSVQAMLKENAISLPYDREPQGESVTWSTNADGYYTISEQKKGESIHLMFYPRK